MATNLSGSNSLPTQATEVIGATYVLLTVPATAQRVDIYCETNAGSFSYEAGAPTVDLPVPADTWFVLWERPLQTSQGDVTIQVKTAQAGTNVFYRVV